MSQKFIDQLNASQFKTLARQEHLEKMRMLNKVEPIRRLIKGTGINAETILGRDNKNLFSLFLRKVNEIDASKYQGSVSQDIDCMIADPALAQGVLFALKARLHEVVLKNRTA